MLKVYIIAGELSGDKLAAPVMQALQARTAGQVEFFGIGGPEMQQAGLHSLFPMHDITAMGIVEIIPKLPQLMRRINETVADILFKKPDIVLTIDAQDFSAHVISRVKQANPHLRCFHYVAPTVWAWRSGRAKKLAKHYDGLLSLFPFEAPFFTRHGLKVWHVGHPLITQKIPDDARVSFRQRHAIGTNDPVLCVLPGSRTGEIKYLWPVFQQVMALQQQVHAHLKIIIPVASSVRQIMSDHIQQLNNNHIIVVENDDDKWAAFAASDMALAASGTVALELALARTPMVIGYCVNPITAWLGRMLVKTPYFSLVNILLRRPAIPEYIQENCRAEKLHAALLELWHNPIAAEQQRQAMNEAIAMLWPVGRIAPATIAASALLDGIKK